MLKHNRSKVRFYKSLFSRRFHIWRLRINLQIYLCFLPIYQADIKKADIELMSKSLWFYVNEKQNWAAFLSGTRSWSFSSYLPNLSVIEVCLDFLWDHSFHPVIILFVTNRKRSLSRHAWMEKKQTVGDIAVHCSWSTHCIFWFNLCNICNQKQQSDRTVFVDSVVRHTLFCISVNQVINNLVVLSLQDWQPLNASAVTCGAYHILLVKRKPFNFAAEILECSWHSLCLTMKFWLRIGPECFAKSHWIRVLWYGWFFL